MKLKVLILNAIWLSLQGTGHAQIISRDVTLVSAFTVLYIEPASTSLVGGKANLTVKPLTRRGDTYTGDYQLKVSPYFFKSEKGKLSILFSDESLHQITLGKAVKFSGTATTNGSEKIKPIIGVATPSAEGRGSVSFSITTDNGVLVFNSTYKVADK